MKAAIFEQYHGPISVREVATPKMHEDAVLISVKACGICRSDWHAWMGHDPDVLLPHVPGHELAGVIANVGSSVSKWKIGDRVTVPFCCGCGSCFECRRGNSHICDSHTQPGFTHWGSFAELVEIRHADLNLVALPEFVDFIAAASLGCRFITAFRGIVDQGKLAEGEWLAVHGCGGVGLSSISIAKSLGAKVIAIDIRAERLALAARLGADACIEGTGDDVIRRVREISGRGADVSIDALGHHRTCWNSIECLAKRGRHVQIGLMLGDQSNPAIPMATVIAKELEIYGSHGMQPTQYSRIFECMENETVNPKALVTNVVDLESGAKLLMEFDRFPNAGMTVIEF
ncbi:MAG: zinc-dependent alcohol dehydrogenase family protein [Planctomycetes bacterium]|nr:zinc-dependent alcohol dehydrogenase family protein [Planctomycetota bacterium]